MFNKMKKVLLLTVSVAMAATLLLCGCSESTVGEESADDISVGDMGSDLTSEDGNSTDIQEDKLLINQDATPGIYDTVSGEQGEYFVIKNDNTLWAWGDNYNGQLGIGTVTADIEGPQQTEPVMVMEDVKTVSSGGLGGNDHTLIVKTDGTLWGCGSNRNGQLGTGSIGDGLHPTPEYIMDDVIFVCSSYSSFAIKSDNSLWAWGDNLYGELGTGSEDETLVPTKVMDDVVYVCGGGEISCAIKTDGSLWVWGGFWGEYLNQDPIYEPMHIADDVVAASLEDYNDAYVFFLKSDGTLWRESTGFGVRYYTDDGQWVSWDGEEEPQNQATDIATIVGGEAGRVSMIVKSDGTVFGRENYQIIDDVKLN